MNGQPAANNIEIGNAALVRPSTAPVVTGEISEMLMYEELARARIRELLAVVRTRRIGRLVQAVDRTRNRSFRLAGRGHA